MKSVSIFAAALVLNGTAAFAAIDSGLLNLAMPDAKVLSGVQVDQTLVSPFGQYILNQFQPSDPGFLSFISSTGFDPRRDLRELLAATSGSNNSGLVLGRGTFQVAQITATATAHGGTVTQYHGLNIITAPSGQGSGAAAFLDGGIAVIGDLASVQAALDRRTATKPSVDPVLVKRATDASAINQAWFATTSPLSDFLNGKTANPNLNNLSQNNLFQSITQASGGINFAASGVTISGDAVTASADNARALVDVLKFLVSMIPSNNPTLKSLGDAATFSVNDTTAHISLALSEQQAEQLFTAAPKRAAAVQRN